MVDSSFVISVENGEKKDLLEGGLPRYSVGAQTSPQDLKIWGSMPSRQI